MSEDFRPVEKAAVKTPHLRSVAPTGLTADNSGVPDSAESYQLQEHLAQLYGAGTARMLSKRLQVMAQAVNLAELAAFDHTPAELTERDQLLITYGDTVMDESRAPLATLKEFADSELRDAFSGVHVLPFFPYSSDDGFAVIDYTQVREDLGSWEDIKALSERFDLMFDLVINHCSREHLWFADFVGGRAPGCDYFLTPDLAADLSQVVRPRNTPLLSPVHTYRGVRHVWTTFGEDQVDLNFANPDVLCRMVEIILLYVQRGARFLRLDAIAFLWKRPGSNCSSLPETHAVVKILRLLLKLSGADVCLLTETNVPHEENVSYFGNRDEAQLVYQFSLAPLLLYSYLFADGRDLGRWASELTPPPAGCSYLNFLASHDGVGLRPLEGLLPEDQVQALIDRIHGQGGFVTLRQLADGSERAYELNTALFSAFGGRAEDIPAYIGAHQLLLAFQGVPAVYLNALLGTLNDLEGVERTGRTRSINRAHWPLEDLRRVLADPGSHHSRVFQGLMHALALRRQQPAFAPAASQQVIGFDAGWLMILRQSEAQCVLVVASFSDQLQDLAWPPEIGLTQAPRDLLTGIRFDGSRALHLGPYQVLWLEIGNAG